MEFYLVDSSNPSGMGGIHWNILNQSGPDTVDLCDRCRAALGSSLALERALRAPVWYGGGGDPYAYRSRALTEQEREAIRAGWPGLR